MKVIIYASLSTNGQVLLAEEASHQVPQDILMDFSKIAAKTGNVVMGRKTFDLFLKNPGARQAFQGIEMVVVSSQVKEAEWFTFVSSPQEALKHLSRKGFKDVLIAGGTETYGSFIAEGLLDELYLNVNPLITGNGGAVPLPGGLNLHLELTSSNKLSRDVVQLHYKVPK